MAKNKSVYEIMGSADDIIRSDDYQVHARANPQDHYVTPKSASTRLAEDKGYKQRQLNAAILGSVGQLMQQAGQLKDAIDKPQIEMDTYNLDQQASKDTNAWETWKVQNQSTYEAMSPDERNARRSQAYAGSNELAATMHKDVQLKWGSVFSKMSEKETLGNIPKDFQRLITLKTNNIFEEFAALTVGDDGNPITQEDWNNKLNARLLNFQANHKIPMKDINKWIGESAINSLNSDDERWFNYAESRQMFNTAEFINDGVTARKQTALDAYRKRLIERGEEAQITAIGNAMANGDQDAVNAITQLQGFNNSEITKKAEELAVQQMAEKETELLQVMLTDPSPENIQEYQEVVHQHIINATKNKLTVDTHKRSIDVAHTYIGTGRGGDETTFKTGLATWRAYYQVSPAKAKEIAGDAHKDYLAFDILDRTFGTSEAHQILLNGKRSIGEKNKFGQDDFNTEDDWFFSKEWNGDADYFAADLGNLLQSYGMLPVNAKAKAMEARNERFPIIRADKYTSDGFWTDYTFRIDADSIDFALSDPDFLARHQINDNGAIFKTKLLQDTIPRFLSDTKQTLTGEFEGENLTLKAHPTMGDGFYYVADSTGYTRPFMRTDPDGNVTTGELVVSVDDLAYKQFEYAAQYRHDSQPINQRLKELNQILDRYETNNQQPTAGVGFGFVKAINKFNMKAINQAYAEREKLLGYKAEGLTLEEGLVRDYKLTLDPNSPIGKYTLNKD